MIVIDASMAAAIVLPDETAPPAPVLERIYAGPLIVPAHWPAEIGNALLMATRRKRITIGERPVLVERVRLLDAVVIAPDVDAAWDAGLALAEEHGLTLYDAAYLQLAIARSAALATNDGALIDAARRCGVDILTG